MNKQTLQQLLDTYEKETGYTRYDAEQIALRYAELAVKEERERIVEFLMNEIENWGEDYSYQLACRYTIEYLTKVEE